MKKRVFGRRLQRDKNERTGRFKSLMSSLVLFERIQTTQAKAKAIKSQIEKLVTQIKKKRDPKNNHMETYLSAPAIQKLVQDIAPRFAQKPGGYTRIIKVVIRFSAKPAMVPLQWG